MVQLSQPSTHLPTRRLSGATTTQLQATLDEATKDPHTGIPGLVYIAVDAHGEVFSHASGSIGLGVTTPMTLDSIFYLASCTKLMTAIACMQLVERGLIGLDDANQVEELAPELAKVEVLERTDEGTLRLIPKERGITLRMLLNHTAGFGYAFEDAKYVEWAGPRGIDDFSGFQGDVLLRPLVNQPGKKFQYGTSVDWAGVLVERITKLDLQEYFWRNIWTPLGINHISFFPDQKLQEHLVHMHQRVADGTLSLRDHAYRYPLALSGVDPGSRYCMGGAGCFGRPSDVCKLISMLLNNGISPHDGSRLLKKETIDGTLSQPAQSKMQQLNRNRADIYNTEMFSDQIAHLPRDCNAYTPSARPDLANPCPLVPMPEGLTEGWGLSFSLSHQPSKSGRAAGAASWEGLPNIFWFADRVNGLGGLIATQILPFGDLKVLAVAEEIETMIYDSLLGRGAPGEAV